MKNTSWVSEYFEDVLNKKSFFAKQAVVGLYSVIVFAFVVIFVLRLGFLQGIKGLEYRNLSDNNRFFTRYIAASRGIFLDRYENILVRNVPVYKMATNETKNTLTPTYTEVSKTQALDAIENGESLVLIDQKREYVYGEALSHVLGYTGEVTREELEQNNTYYLGENIGKTGLEKTQNAKLTGQVGKDVLETDARGHVLQTISHDDPISGENLKLSIDASFSASIFKLFNGKKGAFIASNPKTGEVYALLSSPSFNRDHIQEALIDKDLPMLNRGIYGLYPPGSVFKMMTSLAALTFDAIKVDTEIMDEGQLKLGEAIFRNWYFTQYGKTEGNISVVRALQRSNDIFFYKAAELVGPEKIAEMSRMFQYGNKTGIELPAEQRGVIPDPAWKLEMIGERWYLGDTYHMGIGQGNILVTPIQVNTATQAIANNGVWCKPHLLLDTKPECKDLGINKEYLLVVIDGMKAACAQGGTGYPFFSFTPTVACKTGTAEFGGVDEKGRRKTHAWFTVFAPADDPEIVMTVFLEGTEDTKFLEGSSDAAPIAKEAMQLWFSKREE